MVIQGFANGWAKWTHYAESHSQKYRVLIKALKKTRPNVNLDLDNRLRIIMARWLKLTYNTVPLGIPDPHRTIHSDASGSGIGFMINSAKYQMTLDKSMEH